MVLCDKTRVFYAQASELEVTDSLARQPESPWLLLFGWYLVVMMHNDSASFVPIIG